ncbi:unnamed protein product [Owenia fusiformis]|uniref:Coiled-coil domain-containing protein 149 n=1 Tax=Owenia fusiformis TaxID=6347 RepID=A0A8S4NM95_OWEFU|nr:unnamed protein product [Owenia fusiformis]
MSLIEHLTAELESVTTEYQACRQKLDSKCEALLILSKEVAQCRSERDQFKLMAEQIQERYQGLKRQIAGLSPRSDPYTTASYGGMKSQNLVELLCDAKETNKELQFQADDYKQKLHDAQGDIKLLREQIARQRVGTTDEGMNTRHFPAHEREDLVKQLEAASEQYAQVEKDIQRILDEKEDLETERDAYKTKYNRLNQELNYILKGDEKRIVDIDALSMDNKYLHERLKQMEEEKTIAMATASKYKSILERKKNKGILKLGQTQSRSGGVVITQKQVQQLLEDKSHMTSPQALADLQALATALLETVNDKNMALSHQRKTNKILGNRVNELEKKLKTLEVSGLWNVPANGQGGHSNNLDKLQQECADVKTLIPRQASVSSHTASEKDLDDLESCESVPTSPLDKYTHTGSKHMGGLCLEDLDLLPTKDDSGKVGVEQIPNNSKPDLPESVAKTPNDQLFDKISKKFEEEFHLKHSRIEANLDKFMQDIEDNDASFEENVYHSNSMDQSKADDIEGGSDENGEANDKGDVIKRAGESAMKGSAMVKSQDCDKTDIAIFNKDKQVNSEENDNPNDEYHSDNESAEMIHDDEDELKHEGGEAGAKNSSTMLESLIGNAISKVTRGRKGGYSVLGQGDTLDEYSNDDQDDQENEASEAPVNQHETSNSTVDEDPKHSAEVTDETQLLVDLNDRSEDIGSSMNQDSKEMDSTTPLNQSPCYDDGLLSCSPKV